MEKNLSHEDIIRLLKNEKEFLRKEYGVIKIGLFGSFAKGTQVFDSDIDFLVELEKPQFECMAGLQIYLEKNSKEKLNWFGKVIMLTSDLRNGSETR